MRRILIISLLLTAAGMAGAQSIDEAYLFSQNQYYGTARSIGMGNAMTAVGGDLGSISFNPAGSAVAGYSQITLSPGVSIASSAASFGSPAADGSYYSFGGSTNSHSSRMTMPNAGVVLNFNTGSRQGLKSLSVGIVGNTAQYYSQDFSASGYNSATSIARAAARTAEGLGISAANLDNYANDWLISIGHRAGLFDTYIDPLTGEETVNRYVGITESVLESGERSIPTDRGTPLLHQRYRSWSRGSKYDLLVNVAANISDRFYIGASLGITSLDYRHNMYVRETADDPSYFVSTYLQDDGSEVQYAFSSLNHILTVKTSGTGIFAKFGFIAKPADGLRIGAAIQTPASFGMDVVEQEGAEVHFEETSFAPAAEDGSYSYRLRTPYRVNAGLAYTFGQYGLVSADYELCDYSTMKFKAPFDDDWAADDYSRANEDIRSIFGMQHCLRAGGEFRPFPSLALRAGYGFMTCPEKDPDRGGYFREYWHSVALGAGYSSAGSFFADLSCRLTVPPDLSLYAYSNDYAPAPGIDTSFRLWDIVLTFGWRF